MNKISKRENITKIFAVFLAFVLSILIAMPVALAAPEDEEDDDIQVIEIDLTDGETVGVTEDDIENDTLIEDDEDTETVTETTEETTTTNNGKTTTTTTTETTEETTTTEGKERNQGAFTVDGNGTIQDVITDGTKEFYTILTNNGGVLYLLIDRANGLNNVYLLSAVDETDLLDFASTSSSDDGDSTTTTTTTTTTTAVDEYGDYTGYEIIDGIAYPVDEDIEVISSDSSSGSSSTTLIVILVIIVILVVALLYMRRRNGKKKKNDEDEGDISIDDEDINIPDDDDDEDEEDY